MARKTAAQEARDTFGRLKNAAVSAVSRVSKPRIVSPVTTYKKYTGPDLQTRALNVAGAALEPFARAQRFVESPRPIRVVPKFQAPKTQYPGLDLGGKAAVVGGNIVGDIVNRAANVFYGGASDIGRLSAAALQRKPIPQYRTLKSPISRMGYNVLGYQRTPSEVVRNVAGVAEPIFDLYGGGAVFNLGRQAIKQAGRQVLKRGAQETSRQLIKREIRRGATYGGIVGGLAGLSSENEQTLQQRLAGGAVGAGAGIAVGGLLGGGIAGGGAAIGKTILSLKQIYKQLNPQATEKQIQTAVDGYIRNRLGQFSKKPERRQFIKEDFIGGGSRLVPKGTKQEPAFYKNLDNRLGIEGGDVLQTISNKTPIGLQAKPTRNIMKAQQAKSPLYSIQDVTPSGFGPDTTKVPQQVEGMPQTKIPVRQVSGQTGASPLVRPQNRTPLQIAETKQTGVQRRMQQAVGRNRDGQVSSLADSIQGSDIDVKSKVGLLDYIRTPDRVLKKMGLKKESDLIRKKYDDYLADLPKYINKITQWSKQVPKESNQRIFQYLDGQGVKLNAKEGRVAGEIKQYLSQWADKLGLPQDSRIANYVTHIFEKDFIQKEFDPEIARLIRDRVPGSVYDPFLEKRLGKMGYVEDTWRALDAYTKRATRKFHMDQALRGLQQKAEKLEESQFNYVKSYIDRINLRPTNLDNLLDNTIKQVVGYRFGQRPVASLSRTARQMVYRGTLGINVGSALRNLTQGVNTYSELGEKYTLKGYTNLIKNLKSGELEKVGVLSQDLLQDRAPSATNQAIQKLDKGLFALFEFAERINRGSAYFGAKAKALDSGMNEQRAIQYAKDLVRKTQFTFGSVDTPVGLQSDLAKTIAQLQTFTIKQGEFLGEKIQAKDIAGLTRYVGGSIVMLSTIGNLFGMELKDLIPTFRLGVPPTLGTPIEIGKAVMGVPDKYGNVPETQERIENVGKSLIPYVPGGVQMKKSIQGLSVANKGYSESRAGRVQYTVPKNTETKIRGALFGKGALPQSKEYFKNKENVLGEKQSARVKAFGPQQYKKELAGRYRDEMISSFISGDRNRAIGLQRKYGIVVTKDEIQKQAKKEAVDAYFGGDRERAGNIQKSTGVSVSLQDLKPKAKEKAIALFLQGKREEAARLQRALQLTITRKDLYGE